jgi:hypothetical protein
MGPIIDGDDFVQNVLAVNPDINDMFMDNEAVRFKTDSENTASLVAGEEAADAAPSRAKKRTAEPAENGDKRKRKVAKTSESSDRNADAAASHPFFAKGFKAGQGAPATKVKKAQPAIDRLRTSRMRVLCIVQSRTANLKSAKFQSTIVI